MSNAERFATSGMCLLAGTVAFLWCQLYFCPDKPYIGLMGLTASSIQAMWFLSGIK